MIGPLDLSCQYCCSHPEIETGLKLKILYDLALPGLEIQQQHSQRSLNTGLERIPGQTRARPAPAS